MTKEATLNLQQLAYQSILDLVSEDGLNASGRDEVFGCLFGRDSAISIIKILRALPKYDLSFVDRSKLLTISKHTLESLLSLQGQHINVESGEQPGKFLHEYRKNNLERLLTLDRPWYVYPDGTIKNYDSIDSTPLTLIALYKYAEVSGDHDFIAGHKAQIKLALNWIEAYGDLDGDGLLEYELPALRQHGGLRVQSWTDSTESLLKPDGSFPVYPIAPVEVQGYAWLALKRWADYFAITEPAYAKHLNQLARRLKHAFNRQFLFTDHEFMFAAQALDGQKHQIQTVTGNPLLLLWASYSKALKLESILDSHSLADIVHRSFLPDMFDPEAGIRTMSTLAPTYNPGVDSYHNGSFWPKLNGMAHEGLELWHYQDEADRLKQATLTPLLYFQTPIELYIKAADGQLREFQSPTGQTGCRTQAWTAAVAFDLMAP